MKQLSRQQQRRMERKTVKTAPEGPPPAPEMLPVQPSSPWAATLVALLLAAAAVAAYWNTLGNDFVTWDDTTYITENKLVTGDGRLRAIWGYVFQQHTQHQYYPVVVTSFWLEYRYAGLNPKVYHATQFALHALNAVLILFVLRWLGVGFFPAAFTAAFFAVHPINVASVAWTTERKNTLSALFMLLSLLLYLQYRRKERLWLYPVSAACFALALLSKTSSLALAPLIIVTDRVIDRRWTLSSVLRSLPYFGLGAGMALITMMMESKHGRSGVPPEVWLRPLIACAALVHYVVKTFAPIHLIPVYPRWSESPWTPRYWISLGAVALTAAALWRYRKQVSGFALWGVALFVLTLLPVLGLKYFNYLQYSFVSDHYVYLSVPGLFLIVGLMLDRWRRGSRADAGASETHPAPTPAATVASAVEDSPAAPAISPETQRRPFSYRDLIVGAFALAALAACAWLTIQQNRVWKNGLTMWEYTLAHNPDNVSGNYNLGNHYNRRGEYEKALGHYQVVARVLPEHVNIRKSCATCCRNLGQVDEAVAYYKDAIRVAEETNRVSVDALREYGAYLRSLGRAEEALEVYEKLLSHRPNDQGAADAAASLRRQLGRNSAP